MATHDKLLGSTTFLMANSELENSSISPNKLLLDYHAFLAETDTLLLSLGVGNLHEGMSSTTPLPSTQDQFMDDQKLTGAKDGQVSDERLQLRNAQTANRRLNYRQKLRQERKTLQQQKIDLSSELRSLLQKRETERRSQAKNLGLAVWKAIAIREREKRTVAEQKRRQLREAVILQARVFDRMNVQLQQHPIEDIINPLCTDASQGEAQDCVGELDGLFAQTDQVMLEGVVKIRI